MYAIVRAGGRQEKVAVGDVLVVDRLAGETGSSVSLTPLLLVDGETVTSAADALASTSVTAEVSCSTASRPPASSSVPVRRSCSTTVIASTGWFSA